MDPQKIPSILTDNSDGNGSIMKAFNAVYDALEKANKAITDKAAKKKQDELASKLSAAAGDLTDTVIECMKGIRTDGAALLGRFKPNAYEEAEERIANLKRSFPGGEAWAKTAKANGKKIADASRVLREQLKGKDLELPKAADGKVRELNSLLEKLGTEGRNWFEDAGDDLGSRLSELAKEAARLKELAAGQDGGDTVDQRDRRATKTRNALKELRTSSPDRTIPMYVIVKGSDLFVYVSRDATGGMEQTLRDEVLGGDKSAKFYKGHVKYIDKKYMFVATQLSSGTWTQRIQKSLQNDIGQRLPIAVSNDKGLLEPALTGDDFDDPIDYLISERPVLKDRAKRLKALRAELIKEAEKSGALGKEGKDGTYLATYNRLLDRFDELVSQDTPNLDEAERTIKRIKTDVVTPFLERRNSADSDRKEFEKEHKPIMSWADGIARERTLLFSEIGSIYGKFRDKAPKDNDEIKDVVKQVTELVKACNEASDLAYKAQKGGDYDGEWDKAKTVLFQIDEQRNRWNMAADKMRREAQVAVEKLKKGE